MKGTDRGEGGDTSMLRTYICERVSELRPTIRGRKKGEDDKWDEKKRVQFDIIFS